MASAIFICLGVAEPARISAGASTGPREGLLGAASTAARKPQPLSFSRLISTINEGTVWATFDFGLTCTLPRSGRTLSWEARNNNFDSRVYGQLLASELKAAGFSPANDPDNLFQKTAESDLKIAGNIKQIEAKLCLFGLIVRAPEDNTPPNPDTVTGSILFDINWQIYSNAQDRVVVNKEIRAGAVLTKHAQGNFGRMIQEGIRENIRSLIASDELASIGIDGIARGAGTNGGVVAARLEPVTVSASVATAMAIRFIERSSPRATLSEQN